jgi:trimethylamine--corrinoid protein Co-methyltransferase
MARRSHRRKRIANEIRQLAWRDVINPYAPIEVLSNDHVDAIIEASHDVLATQGMRFLEARSRKVLRQAGADVDETSGIVRFDPSLVKETIAVAPTEFELRARNPAHNLHFGGNHIVFSSVGGPAFCSDLRTGRRPGTFGEMCDFLRLVQSLNIVHQDPSKPWTCRPRPVTWTCTWPRSGCSTRTASPMRWGANAR